MRSDPPEESADLHYSVEPIGALGALEAEWRLLEARASPSFYLSWDWVGTLLECVPENARPMVLRGRAGGRTVALALIGSATVRRRAGLVRSRLAYLNQTGDARYDCVAVEHNGLLTQEGMQATALSALLRWIRTEAARFDEVVLAGSSSALDKSLARRLGLLLRATAVPSFSVNLGVLDSRDGFEGSLSRNARQQLRRAVRRYEAGGPLRLTIADTVAQALEFFAEMKALHCASWQRRGKPHSFTHPFFEPFARRLIERAHPTGSVQLLRASAGSSIIGYLLNFSRGGHVYAYQSGFADGDPGNRPGVVAHYLAIREAARTGAQVYDFMAGANRLKASFANQQTTMTWYVFQQPRWSFRLENWIRQVKARLQSEALGASGEV